MFPTYVPPVVLISKTDTTQTNLRSPEWNCTRKGSLL